MHDRVCRTLLANLVQKFDSDAVLLPCFFRNLFLNLIRQEHDVSSGGETDETDMPAPRDSNQSVVTHKKNKLSCTRTFTNDIFNEQYLHLTLLAGYQI